MEQSAVFYSKLFRVLGAKLHIAQALRSSTVPPGHMELKMGEREGWREREREMRMEREKWECREREMERERNEERNGGRQVERDGERQK